MKLVAKKDGTYTLKGMSKENVEDMYSLFSYGAFSTAYNYLAEVDGLFGESLHLMDNLKQIFEPDQLRATDGAIHFSVSFYKR